MAANAGLYSAALRVMPGGVNSNARLGAATTIMARGEGAFVWDAEGTRYVDFVLGRGPAFLGHAPPDVVAAANAAAADGTSLGATTTLEVRAAQRVLDLLNWPERIRFAVTGTEAVMLALRLARFATRRSLVIQARGAYHGWAASVLDPSFPVGRGGIPESASTDRIAVTWDDPAAIEEVFAAHRNAIAAVLLDPVGLGMPSPGYLEGIRALCSKHGALLIFDEVLCGFRIARGGAVDVLGVVPDLATYGKAIASGWPVAAVAGSAKLLDPLGASEVFHGGTYAGSSPSMAAVVATMDALADGRVHEHVRAIGTRLMDGLASAARDAGLAARVIGYPACFHLELGGLPFGDELDAKLQASFAEEGIWVDPPEWIVSALHGEPELDAALKAAPRAFARVANTAPLVASGNQAS